MTHIRNKRHWAGGTQRKAEARRHFFTRSATAKTASCLHTDFPLASGWQIRERDPQRGEGGQRVAGEARQKSMFAKLAACAPRSSVEAQRCDWCNDSGEANECEGRMSQEG
jgi:hypothetical protein